MTQDAVAGDPSAECYDRLAEVCGHEGRPFVGVKSMNRKIEARRARRILQRIGAVLGGFLLVGIVGILIAIHFAFDTEGVTVGAEQRSVRSKDGTAIAYEKTGQGPVVILVAAALADRGGAKRIAKPLSEHYTVINYESHPPMPDDLSDEITELVAAGRRNDAVKLFFIKGMGIPPFGVTLMRFLMPGWSKMVGMAHTLPYDLAILEANSNREASAKGTLGVNYNADADNGWKQK